ncbi:hypothetical protein [Arthrobacter sp. BE255]|nr:hypothetical protein [Arthrobacter sp. BE255]MDR7160124.1 type IV secretory pathway component VirB8 [Arthrobacter sp. BE255]
MGNFGGTQYARDSRRELRRRRIQWMSYVLFGALAAATVGVVVLALTR